MAEGCCCVFTRSEIDTIASFCLGIIFCQMRVWQNKNRCIKSCTTTTPPPQHNDGRRQHSSSPKKGGGRGSSESGGDTIWRVGATLNGVVACGYCFVCASNPLFSAATHNTTFFSSNKSDFPSVRPKKATTMVVNIQDGGRREQIFLNNKLCSSIGARQR